MKKPEPIAINEDSALAMKTVNGKKKSSHLFLSLNQHFNERSVRIPNPLAPDDPTESNSTQNTRRYSHFRCVGNDNDVTAFAHRSCVFENVCYDLSSKQFQYYVRSDTEKKAVLFDSKKGERKSFYEDGHGFVALAQIFVGFPQRSITWAPTIIAGMSPAFSEPEETIVLNNAHALYSHWTDDDSIGHVLWEEIGGLWYTMIRLNMISSDLVAMHYPTYLPKRPLALKHREAFFPAISDRPPVSFYEYIENLSSNENQNIKNICFDQLMAGGQLLRFFQSVAANNHGHELMYYSLRNRILAHHNLFPSNGKPLPLPKKHRILITNKTEANYKPSADIRNKRTIYNLAALAEYLTQKFSQTDVQVQVIQWNSVSVQEQLELLQDTTILISPAGGVSMIIPFLPEGAHAILIDYLGRNEKTSWFGTKNGESISMDAPFWSHWPHVKKLYYQVWSKEDLRSDRKGVSVEEISNWRDETSVVVNLQKMERLVEAALEDMEP